MTANVQKFATDKEARAQVKLQIAEYMAQQPESTRSADKWMKRLEVASLAIYIGTFVNALIISIRWESVPVATIPAAWFLFVASALPTLLLFGVHAILVKAFPTVVLFGRPSRFVTGAQAVRTGWLLIVSSLIGAAVWGYLTYRIWTSDYATMGAILGVVIGVGITIQLIYTVYSKISKSR